MELRIMSMVCEMVLDSIIIFIPSYIARPSLSCYYLFIVAH